jgi:hypothetical protein
MKAMCRAVQKMTRMQAGRELIRQGRMFCPPDGPRVGPKGTAMRKLADAKKCYDAEQDQKRRDELGHFFCHMAWRTSRVDYNVEATFLETLGWRWANEYVNKDPVIKDKKTTLHTIIVKTVGSIRNSLSQYFKKKHGITYLTRDCSKTMQKKMEEIKKGTTKFKHVVPMVSTIARARAAVDGFDGFVGYCDQRKNDENMMVIPYSPDLVDEQKLEEAKRKLTEKIAEEKRKCAEANTCDPATLEAFFKTLRGGDKIKQEWQKYTDSNACGLTSQPEKGKDGVGDKEENAASDDEGSHQSDYADFGFGAGVNEVSHFAVFKKKLHERLVFLMCGLCCQDAAFPGTVYSMSSMYGVSHFTVFKKSYLTDWFS